MKVITVLIFLFPLSLFSQEPSKSFPVYSISSVEPDSGYLELRFIENYIGNNPIVSVGEATHGSSEFFKIKHKLFKYLVEEKGFTIFALEANMAEAERLNRYIATGEGNPNQLLARLGYWVWNTQEFLDLVIWMKEYNTNHTPKIKFTGFDMQSFNYALSNLNHSTLKTHPKIDSILTTLNDVDKAIRNDIASGNYQKNDSLIQLMYKESNSLFSTLELFPKGDIEILGNEKYSWLLQNSKLIIQYSTRYSSHKPEHGYRDLCMAENLNWIIKNNPNAKVFVWAHNGHVKRNTYTMGEYLLEVFDINPYIIGLTTSQGSYTAISNGVITNNPLNLPEKDCYEYYFNQNEQINFFIDLQNAKDDFTFVSQPFKLREIGSMKRDVQFYDANILKEYDAIIFITETNSSECFFK